MTITIIITMKTIMMTITSIMRVILGCCLSVASSQPITSRIYQRLLYLLTNQITHQGFFEFSTDYENHLTLKMASAQVVETSVTNNSPTNSQDSNHPDDPFQSRYVTPGLKNIWI